MLRRICSFSVEPDGDGRRLGDDFRFGPIDTIENSVKYKVFP